MRISDVKEKKNLLRDIIVNYRELLKLKAMKLLVVYKAALPAAVSLFSVGTIYFLQYNLGLDNKYSSYVYVFTIVIFIVSTPIIEKMALLKGKAWQQMVVIGCLRDCGSTHLPFRVRFSRRVRRIYRDICSSADRLLASQQLDLLRYRRGG